MNSNDKKRFSLDYSFYDSDFDTYFNKDKTFGKFIDNGKAYRIENQDTPRQWLQYLCNDKIRSAIANDGKGFIWHCAKSCVTKQWEKTYLIRKVNGKRTLKLLIDGEKDFFENAENLTETVHPGFVVFNGVVADYEVELTVFVPLTAPCECWQVKIKNNGIKQRNAAVRTGIEWTVCDNCDLPEVDVADGTTIDVVGSKISSISACNVRSELKNEFKKETTCWNNDVLIAETSIETECESDSNGGCLLGFVFGVYLNDEERKQILSCLSAADMNTELEKVKVEWERLFGINRCTLPNKNLEYFLNYWLKNQLYLTYRYDRGGPFNGYRDALQDSWGYCLVDPTAAKDKILKTLSFMYPDGRCPRQYDEFSNKLDERDFSDSPIWGAGAILSYLKETGDYAFLEQNIGFYGSEEQSSVENHMFRALDYMYRSRGKNGLILMRDGDWADGLGGINKYGTGATSVWVTIAAFYAQKNMYEIYAKTGDSYKAQLMLDRCKEYKEIVNRVGWDGNWYIYGFFEDGEPIGSSKNYEGKIWLNPQTWAIFSGIVDDDDKIERITKSINRYLLTPFGSMVCYPPYVFYGERCGRVQKQIPGTFLNGSIYNHAASFKVYSDIARGDFDDAMDSLMRALPNHPDNSDCCRTSEPYAVGNVYYGPNNERFGMNLFTWYTASVAWLIHGGYEEILGVKAGFDGIEINPHIPRDWQNYRVEKYYRGTCFVIDVSRTEAEPGIWVDGVKIDGNVVNSENEQCFVKVCIK